MAAEQLFLVNGSMLSRRVRGSVAAVYSSGVLVAARDARYAEMIFFSVGLISRFRRMDGNRS